MLHSVDEQHRSAEDWEIEQDTNITVHTYRDGDTTINATNVLPQSGLQWKWQTRMLTKPWEGCREYCNLGVAGNCMRIAALH